MMGLAFAVWLLGATWVVGTTPPPPVYVPPPERNPLPREISRSDLEGPSRAPAARLLPEHYELAGKVWADLDGDGRDDLAFGIQPARRPDSRATPDRLDRPAGVLVYRSRPSGALTLAGTCPPGLGEAIARGSGRVVWNRCDRIEARDVIRDGRAELIVQLGFTGADDFGTDTFVLGWAGNAPRDLLPGDPPRSPEGAARGPGRTPLGQFGGGVRFRPEARGGAEIVVWGQVWGRDEAKVSPHRLWADIYRWNGPLRRFVLARSFLSRGKGPAAERELGRALEPPRATERPPRRR